MLAFFWQVGGNLLGLANLALLNFKQMKKIGTSNANMELDRAKEFLTNAIRFVTSQSSTVDL